MVAVTFTSAHPFASLAARGRRLLNRFTAHQARNARYHDVLNELRQLNDRELEDMGITRGDFDAIASGRYTR